MALPNDHLFQNLPPRPISTDTRWRAHINPAPNCPRCASSNTKFCYYNNYSLSQPRFFCKGCRRYWTKGGSLRNVPIGGGCRKSRRSRSSKGSFSSSRSNNNALPNLFSTCSESTCPDIDLAAVFAKFLNPEDMNEATPNTSSEASYDSPISSLCGLENGFDYPKLSDEFLDFVPSDDKQLQVEEVDQEGYTTPDLGSFDGILDDVFWSEDCDFSGITRMQELDSSSLLPAEECNSTTNLLFSINNWSYFDNAGFEVLSGP